MGLHIRADMFRQHLTGIRVTGAVREKQTVRLQRVEIVVPRHADNLYATADEATDDIMLHAAIHENHFLSVLTFVIADDLFAGHLIHKIDVLILRFGSGRTTLYLDRAEHHAVLAQHHRQRSRVDSRDTGYTLADQPFGKGLFAVPVAELAAVLAADDRPCINAVGLHIRRQTIRFKRKLRHAVVAYQRISQRHQLARITGVGQRLRITHHRGIEDHLTAHRHIGAEAVALERHAVAKSQYCFFYLHIVASRSGPTEMIRIGVCNSRSKKLT